MYFSKSSKYLSAQNINEKFYPFCEKGKDLCQKIREDMTGGPSIVFTRKAVVDKAFIRDSSNICKSIVGIDASQFYPYSRSQDMPTWLYTRWQFDSDMQKYKLDITDLKALRLRRCLTTKKQEQNAELKASTHLEIKKIVCFNVDGYCDHCKTVFEAMGCYYHFVLARRLVPHLARKILREEKNERDGWLETWINSRKRLQNQRDVGKNHKNLRIISDPTFHRLVPHLARKILREEKNERDGWLETWINSRKRLQNQRDVGKNHKNLRIISDPTFHSKDLSLMILYWEK